jgi:hypothetical protein
LLNFSSIRLILDYSREKYAQCSRSWGKTTESRPLDYLHSLFS